ncbi:MAG: hypothetical protein FWH21_08890 [Kiritimatiellaeota bacterium]|nr:hypothetical protein [Kiritimatiellota bacterium]
MKFLSNRGFNETCLLENGQEFICTDSKADIYLVNIAERKVGQIALGKDFITLMSRYRQNLWEEMDKGTEGKPEAAPF